VSSHSRQCYNYIIITSTEFPLISVAARNVKFARCAEPVTVDYGSATAGVPGHLLGPLQSVHHVAAARLVYRSRKYDHACLLLRDFRCLACGSQNVSVTDWPYLFSVAVITLHL